MMLCEVGSVNDLSRNWIGERKIDGCRCLAICNDENIKLVGRNGTDYTSKFQEVVDELKTMNLKGIFDGEIVCDTFNHTSSRVHNQNKLKAKLLQKEYPAVLWIFDKLGNQTLLERKKQLDFQGNSVKCVEFTYNLKELWERAEREKWEGIVIKNPLSYYEKKRSANWLKIKRNKFKDIEFNEYSVNPAGIRVQNPEGIFVQISGSQSRAVKETIDNTGSAVCEIKYLEELDSGKLRMPTFSKLKDVY